MNNVEQQSSSSVSPIRPLPDVAAPVDDALHSVDALAHVASIPTGKASAPTTAPYVKVKFEPGNKGFHATVKKRVDAYFDENHIARGANAEMYLKTLFWAGGALALYALLLSNFFGFWGTLATTSLLGFFVAGIGFNIGHDGLHGAYSDKSWVNRFFGWSFQIVGAASYNWIVSHNVVHHTYTNIPGHDNDIEPGPFMRFHVGHKVRPIYRFQQYYAWFLYTFTTLNWVYFKDVIQLFEKDPRTGKRPPPVGVASIVMSKVFHFAFLIAAPLLLVDLPWWQILICIVAAQQVAGFTLALVFQLAHVVEGPVTPLVDENGAANRTWAEHQMLTTANFSRGSKWAQFICGGLNYQVEHHLFPRVCHVHYPEIAPIVEQTAKEFGLPYLENKTFWSATVSHYRMLKFLGTAPQVVKQSEQVLPEYAQLRRAA